MPMNDWIALFISYIYAFGLLVVVETVGKHFNWPKELTRKIIHIGAGMWVWGVIRLFDNWYMGIIPFATFIVLNFIFYKFKIFKMMDQGNETPGTVYFAISITLLFILFWRSGGQTDRVHLAIAPIMAMTWGDALAGIAGHFFAKKQYIIFGHRRSWLGSVVMFFASFIVVAVTLIYLPQSALSPKSAALSAGQAIWLSLITASTATIIEGISPKGLDNLSVPLFCALVLWIFIP